MNERIGIFILVLLALGALLVAVLPRLAPGRMRAAELWPLYGVQLAIVGFALAPAYVGGWTYLMCLLALGARAQWELLQLARPNAATTPPALGCGAFALLAVFGLKPELAVLSLPIAAIVVGALLPRPSERRFGVQAASLAIPGGLVAGLVLLGRLEDGFAWIAFAYVVVEVNDTGAYLLGKAFGRRRILPRLSPGKTEAGLFGGIACALLAGPAMGGLVLELSWGVAAGATLAALFGGLAGDLATSWIKRRYGAKDFPPVHSSHGGALDIYDSLLFAAPVLYLFHLAVVA